MLPHNHEEPDDCFPMPDFRKHVRQYALGSKPCECFFRKGLFLQCLPWCWLNERPIAVTLCNQFDSSRSSAVPPNVRWCWWFHASAFQHNRIGGCGCLMISRILYQSRHIRLERIHRFRSSIRWSWCLFFLLPMRRPWQGEWLVYWCIGSLVWKWKQQILPNQWSYPLLN